MGMDHFMSQAIVTHTTGTAVTSAGATFVTNGALAVGDTTITITTANVADTLSILTGDLLTITDAGTGIKYQFVVAEDASVTTNAVTITVVNPVPAIIDTASTIIFAGAVTGEYDKNYVGHRDAIGFIMIPLRSAGGAVDQTVFNQDGISYRITIAYDVSKKKNIVSIDAFFGTAVMWDILGQVVIGGGDEE